MIPVERDIRLNILQIEINIYQIYIQDYSGNRNSICNRFEIQRCPLL